MTLSHKMAFRAVVCDVTGVREVHFASWSKGRRGGGAVSAELGASGKQRTMCHWGPHEYERAAPPALVEAEAYGTSY